MAQTMINQLKNLKERIQLLRSTGDISLKKINRLETYLNRRKQLNQYPLNEDINLLNQLVKSQLKMLAEIRTCEYFISCYEAISIFSPRYIEMHLQAAFFKDKFKKTTGQYVIPFWFILYFKRRVFPLIRDSCGAYDCPHANKCDGHRFLNFIQ